MRLVALATVGSTNTEAPHSRAAAAKRGPLWVTAVAQTAGRGRHGPRLGFAAGQSLCEPACCAIRRRPSARRNSLSSRLWPLRDAIVAEAPALAPKLAFKWPNDVLLGGRKVRRHPDRGRGRAGQELERRHRHRRQLREPSAGRGLSGDRSSRPRRRHHAANSCFQRLSGHDVPAPRAVGPRRGFPAILADWLAAARGIGEEITVRNGAGEKHGRFVGLDRAPAGLFWSAAAARSKKSRPATSFRSSFAAAGACRAGLKRWRRTNSSSRRSAASARSG